MALLSSLAVVVVVVPAVLVLAVDIVVIPEVLVLENVLLDLGAVNPGHEVFHIPNAD